MLSWAVIGCPTFFSIKYIFNSQPTLVFLCCFGSAFTESFEVVFSLVLVLGDSFQEKSHIQQEAADSQFAFWPLTQLEWIGDLLE